MKLSTKSRYGLRALVDLGSHCENGEAVSVQDICERQHISDSYLEQLMRKLRTAGIVSSVRGAGGGYVLARPAGDISVGDALRALEGSIHPVTCVDDEAGCDQMDFCVTHAVWERVNKAIESAVDTVTLGELIRDAKEKEALGQIDTSSCKN